MEHCTVVAFQPPGDRLQHPATRQRERRGGAAQDYVFARGDGYRLGQAQLGECRIARFQKIPIEQSQAHFGLAGSEQNPQTCAVFEEWRTLQRAQRHCQPMRHLQATWRNQRHAAAQVAHFDPAQIDRNPLARLGGRRLLAMDLDCPHPEPAPRRQQFERIATGNRGPAQRAGDDSAVPGYSKSAVYGEVCNAAGAARRLVPDQCEQGLA